MQRDVRSRRAAMLAKRPQLPVHERLHAGLPTPLWSGVRRSEHEHQPLRELHHRLPGGHERHRGMRCRQVQLHVQGRVPRLCRQVPRADGPRVLRPDVHGVPRSRGRRRHLHRRHLRHPVHCTEPRVCRQVCHCDRPDGVRRGLHGVPGPDRRHRDMQRRRVRGLLPGRLSSLRHQVRARHRRDGLRRRLHGMPDAGKHDRRLHCRSVCLFVQRWLRRLHTELKFTSIFVTHDQQEAIEVADTIVVLNRGRIEQAGIPGEVYDAPRSAYVHRFLGQVNELPVRWHNGRAMVGPLDITGASASEAAANERASPHIALVRPHEIDVGGEFEGWRAVVRDVRVIGPIVRLELCADGHPVNEPLEAEISRERFDVDNFHIGQAVGVRFRRWQLYPTGT